MEKYNNLGMFWLPIIEARAAKHSHSAEDCLLNPIFCWSYLNTKERLGKLEKELKKLEETLTSDDFKDYHNDLAKEMITKALENEVHNRMLDARAEIRGMLHYAESGHSITLEPRQPKIKTPDFNACSSDSNIAVEAKFLRHPDKLREYLMRWWAAAEAISGTRPLGIAPYIKFKWKPINSKNDLNLDEIEKLKQFFRSVFIQHKLNGSLSTGRIQIEYSPDNSLSVSIRPLGTIEQNAKHPVDLLIKKMRVDIEDRAKDQLKQARESGMQTACYLLVNITSDIEFEWPKNYNSAKQTLKEEYSRQELEIVIEEVEYL
ncbi:MAG: hypothetical protein NOU37_00820 [Candidatus Brocadiales bacterium]|nr:hypothetical protein [Candidatus Bathyanammoxibius amoris]